jgi:hypothetical protein
VWNKIKGAFNKVNKRMETLQQKISSWSKNIETMVTMSKMVDVLVAQNATTSKAIPLPADFAQTAASLNSLVKLVLFTH